MPIFLIDKIKQKNALTFALLDDTDLDGGFRVVADATARDAVPADSRKEGMCVYSQSESTLWHLKSGLTDSDWALLYTFDAANDSISFLYGAQFGSGTTFPTSSLLRISAQPAGQTIMSVSHPTTSEEIALVRDGLQYDDSIYFGYIPVSGVVRLEFTGNSHSWTTPDGEMARIEGERFMLGALLGGLAGLPIGFTTATITFASANFTLSSDDDKSALVLVCGGVMGGSERELRIGPPANDAGVHIVDARGVDQDIIVYDNIGGGDGVTVKSGGVQWVRWDSAGAQWVKLTEGPWFDSSCRFDGDVSINSLSLDNGPHVTGAPGSNSVTTTDGKLTINEFVGTYQTTNATPGDAISTWAPTLTDEAAHKLVAEVSAVRADGSVVAEFDITYRGRMDGGAWTQNEAVTVTKSPAGTSLDATMTVPSNKPVITVTGIAATNYTWGISLKVRSMTP